MSEEGDDRFNVCVGKEEIENSRTDQNLNGEDGFFTYFQSQ